MPLDKLLQAVKRGTLFSNVSGTCHAPLVQGSETITLTTTDRKGFLESAQRGIHDLVLEAAYKGFIDGLIAKPLHKWIVTREEQGLRSTVPVSSSNIERGTWAGRYEDRRSGGHWSHVFNIFLSYHDQVISIWVFYRPFSFITGCSFGCFFAVFRSLVVADILIINGYSQVCVGFFDILKMLDIISHSQ